MRSFPLTSAMRLLLLFIAGLLPIAAAPATNAPPSAIKPAPYAAPAFLDVVSFEFNSEGEPHKIVVTSAPSLARVDETTEGYSVIYNPATDFYTGLEHRNYTYWQFSWPEIRDAVETSKRHEARLQQLNNEGLTGENDATFSTNAPDASVAPASGSAGGVSDDSGYVWRPTTDHKRIADLQCVRWISDTLSGEHVEAWCYAGPVPKVQAAIERLRVMSEPLALVPVRTIVPDFIFPVYTALIRGGVTPLLITWGDGDNKSYFRLVQVSTRDGKIALFTVPKLYVKTTLITMDGMTTQQPVREPRTTAPAKTWQDLGH